MKKNLISLILIFLLFSCKISEHIDKAFEITINSTYIVPMSVTTSLIESTSAIYNQHSLHFNTPIYINSLTLNFSGEFNPFELIIDSIKAMFINDTVIDFKKIIIENDNSILYKKLDIPTYNSYLGTDSIRLNIECKYLPNMDFLNGISNLECITTNYIINIKEYNIFKNEFKKCR